MAIAINGSGTITGISQGGLNDNIITKNEMAASGAWAPAGTVLQVVQGTLSGSISSSSASYVDTGLTASITPTSATSKILVTAFHPVPAKQATNRDVNLQVVRSAPTSSTLLSFGDALYAENTANNYGTVIGGSYLDSPATTSTVTYKTQFCNGQGATGAIYIQTGGNGTITLMEIAA